MFKSLNKLIFTLDVKSMFSLVKPLKYPAKSTYKISIINIIHSISPFNKRDLIHEFLLIIFMTLVNFLKILYLPVIILFYFSKYRFIQMNYSQIGTVGDNLNVMVKRNLLKGYKSIILIPNYYNFNFVKKIFKNLIIIDNTLLNILLLPLKHSRLISCTGDDTNPTYLNRNLRLVNSSPFAKIHMNYINSLKKKDTLYDFNNEFDKEMKHHVKKNYSHFKLAKTFVFHHRENYFAGTSNLRGSELSTYRPSIKYLLNKGYGVLRISHSKSKKLFFKNKFYREINTDLAINKKLQYYLIAKCRGFICNDSGPASMGPLFSKPVYCTNMHGTIIAAVSKKSLFIIKKIKLKKKLISYKKALDLEYFRGPHLCEKYTKKLGFELVNNNKSEILKGLKEFVNLIKKKVKQTSRQKKFKESLPDYIEFKHTQSNIADSFITSNSKFFLNQYKD